MPAGFELSKAYVSIAVNTRKFNTSLARAETKFQAFTRRMKRTAKKFAKIGLAAGAVGVAAGLAKSIETAANFEQAMADARAATNATSSEMAVMNAKAEELGKTSKFMMTEIGAAFKYLGKAGYSAKESVAAIDGVVQAAAASGEDLATVADEITNILKGFKMGADEAGHAADVLAEAARSSNTTIHELAEGMKYVGPVAKDMGVSFEKTVAMLGKLGDAGIKAGQAGRMMRMAFVKFQKLKVGDITEDAEAAIKRFGLSVKKVQDMDFSDFISQMREAGAKAGDFAQIFGTRASTAVALLGDMKKETSDFTDLLESASDAAEAMFKGIKVATPEDLAIAQERLKEAIQKTSDLSAEAAKNLSEKLVKGIRKGTLSIEEFRKQLQGAGVDMDKLGGAAKQMAETQLNTLSGQWTILKSSLEALAVSIGKTALPMLQELLQNAVIPAVNKFNEWTKSVGGLRGMLKGAKKWFEGIFGGAEETKEAMTTLKKIFDEVIHVMKVLFKQAANALKTYFGIIMNAISLVINLLQGDWPAAWQDAKDIMDILINFVKNTFRNLVDLLHLQPVIDLLKGPWQKAWKIAKSIVKAFIDFFLSIPDKISGVVSSITGMVSKVKSAWEEIRTLGGLIGGGGKSAGDIVSEDLKKVSGTIDDLKMDIAGMAKDWKAAGGNMDKFANKAKGNIDLVRTQIKKLKKAGLTQEQIGTAFQKAIQLAPTTKYGEYWKEFGNKVIQYLRKQLKGEELTFQKGGVVPGSGFGDKVLALLEPGEVVLPRKVVEALPRFQKGGMIGPAKKKGGKLYQMAIPDWSNVTQKIQDELIRLATSFGIWHPKKALQGMMEIAKKYKDNVDVLKAVNYYLGLLKRNTEFAKDTFKEWTEDREKLQKMWKEKFKEQAKTVEATTKQFREQVNQSKVLNKVKEKSKQVTDKVANEVKDMGDAAKETAENVMSFGNVLKDAGKSAVDAFAQSIKSSVMDLISDWLDQLLGLAKTTKDIAEVGVPSGFKRMRKAYQAAIPGQKVKKTKRKFNLWKIIAKAIKDAIMTFIDKLTQFLMNNLGRVWQWIVSFLSNPLQVLAGLFNTLSGLINAILSPLGLFIAMVAGAWAASKKFREAIINAISAIWEILDRVFGKIASWVGKLVGKLWKVFEPIFKLLGDYFAPIINHAVDAFGFLIDVLEPVIDLIGGTLAIALDTLAVAVKTLVTPFQWLAGLIKALGNIIKGFINWIANLFKGALNIVGGIVDVIIPFQKGGLTKSEGLAYLHPNEIITPIEKFPKLVADMGLSGTGGVNIENHVYLSGRDVTDLVVEEIQKKNKRTTGKRSTSATVSRRYY